MVVKGESVRKEARPITMEASFAGDECQQQSLLDDNDGDDVSSLIQICQISRERANELLEAASGSLQRAVDIHYSSGAAMITDAATDSALSSSHVSNVKWKQVRQDGASSTKNGNKKKASPSKQSTLDAFLGVSPPAPKKKKGGEQQKIDSFFSPAKDSDENGAKESVVMKEETSPEPARRSTIQANDVTSSPRNSLVVQNNNSNSVDQNIDNDTPDRIKAVGRTPVMKQRPDKDNNAMFDDASYSNPVPSSHELEYRVLVQTLAEMASTTKRNVKLNALKELFVNVIRFVGGVGRTNSDRRKDSLLLTFTIDLVLGKLSTMSSRNDAAASPRPLQVSGSAVSIAVQTVTGASRKQMSEAYRRTGDMGDVAAEFFESKRKNSASHFFVVQKQEGNHHRMLTVAAVHEMLQSIATVPSGKGSQAARQNLLVKLLRSCREKDEVRFLVRTLLGNMRLGATIKTLLVALAAATEEVIQSQDGVTGDCQPEEKSTSSDGDGKMVQTLEEVYHICPRIPEIAHALLQGGIPYAAKHCALTVGFPIQPMLANPASSFEQVRDFLKDSNGSADDKDGREQQYLPAALEWKYDGVRCQAHWDGSAIKLFSRHLLDTTEQFPDVVKFLLEAKSNVVESFVVDSEIVAIVDSGGGGGDGIRLLPFQDLSTRRSTTKQEAVDGIVRVCIFCFDLVYLNGQSLLKEPLWRRQELLRTHFKASAGFRFASSVSLPQYDESVVRSALELAVQGGAEGLMIKLTGEISDHKTDVVPPSSTRTFGYESGLRGKLWLKLKRDYVSGYADTIDVVPIGAWYGSGRKAQKDFLSPVLLAIYDEEEGTFQSISRCMSFSDEMYNAMREFYFRGTPYPPGVGISCDKASDDVKQEAKDGDTNDPLDNQVNGDLRTNDDDAAADDNDDDVFERVNCLPGRPSSYVTNETPSIWFKALEVFEVSFADLSLSRAHAAASDLIGADENRGIALRFPRFKRRRPDKSVEQATTAAQIADLFRLQSKVHK